MKEISSLIIGEISRPEFQGARSTLQSLGRLSCFAEVESASEALASGEIIPEIILIAQAFPGQFSHQAIDRLRRLAPLARLLGLLGSWCEGETRSGHPWPGAIRVYWHQYALRARQELRRLVEGQCPSWGLPITATEEERLLQKTETALPQRRGLIAIHARGFAMADWLSAACRTCGYSTVWLRPDQYTRVEGARAAIFEGSELSAEELEQVRRLANTLNKTPVIALLDFPRIEDQRRAIGAGATAVLSKPLNLEDLYWQLEQSAAISFQ
jgi:hypothetical protein